MASRIQGISVEISGDTTRLTSALQGVNKEIKNTQTQLKDVEKLLKLDPSNTELLSQKQKLLKESIASTKEKLDTLKTAQEQAKAQLENGTLGADKYDALVADRGFSWRLMDLLPRVLKAGEDAGSLTRETTPLGNIFYDYTYQRLAKKRYSNTMKHNGSNTYSERYTFTGKEHDFRGLENPAVLRHQLPLVLVAFVHVVQNRGAGRRKNRQMFGEFR